MKKPQLASPLRHPPKLLVQSPDWFCEEKFDGDRVMLHVDSTSQGAYGRDGTALYVPKPLRKLKTPFSAIFDGEMLNDTFMVFDLPFLQDTAYAHVPFEARRNALENLFSHYAMTNCALVECARTELDKSVLVTEAMRLRKEGVIFKHRTAKYESGLRTKTWLKYKFYKTVDVVITEMYRDGKAEAVTLSIWDPLLAEYVEVGGCKVPSRYQDEQKIAEGDVVEVRYLKLTADHRLYQPVFLRKRVDKQAHECTYDQLVVVSADEAVPYYPPGLHEQI